MSSRNRRYTFHCQDIIEKGAHAAIIFCDPEDVASQRRLYDHVEAIYKVCWFIPTVIVGNYHTYKEASMPSRVGLLLDHYLMFTSYCAVSTREYLHLDSPITLLQELIQSGVVADEYDPAFAPTEEHMNREEETA